MKSTKAISIYIMGSCAATLNIDTLRSAWLSRRLSASVLAHVITCWVSFIIIIYQYSWGQYWHIYHQEYGIWGRQFWRRI